MNPQTLHGLCRICLRNRSPESSIERYMATKMTTVTTCAACRQPVEEQDDLVNCPQCGTVAHRICWERLGKCPAGCIDVENIELPDTDTVDRQHVSRPHENDFTLWIVIVVAAAILLIAGIVVGKLGLLPVNTILVFAVVLAALAFDYVNGMHDAGNAIATVISTRVLTPFAALLMAAVLNLIGAMFFSGVAKSIASKFAMSTVHITPVMILCGLVGASLWSFITARWGLPVSTSHSLFGGLIGVFLLNHIPLNMQYLGLLGFFMVAAPLMAFSAGWLLMILITWVFRNMAAHRVNKGFRVMQFLSSASVAFSHGANDAQKAMGIITLALVSGGFLGHVTDMKHVEVPLWVKIACALVIALGTGFGGMRVIRTLGHKIIKLAPVHGFAAETVAAATIQIVTHLGIPISTTHVISSSILGIGASRRLSAVRWGLAVDIIIAWIITIPTTAIAGALIYQLVKMVFNLH